MKLKNGLFKPMFSHIYIERQLKGSRAVENILSKTGKSEIILIDHYKDVFNKPGQNPLSQQNAKKLILAKNNGRKVFPGAPYCHDFGHTAFYNVSQVLNCPYNCSYCYLKGKYKSANLVAFLNTEDYFNAVDEIAPGKNSFVTLSYDSDEAALEPLLGLLAQWHEFIEAHQDITFELRTKSLYRPLFTPTDNLVIAVSLLPSAVIEAFEEGTPSLDSRIQSVVDLLDSGFQVRLCIDPLLELDDYQETYRLFIEKLANEIELNLIRDISAGCFRMPSGYYKNMQKGYGNHFLHYFPFENRNKQVRYSKELEESLLKSVTGPLSEIIGNSKIFTR